MGRSLPGRTSGRLLTQDGQKNFEDLWSAARPGVERVLQARGVHGADRDDVVQEVALRAYTAWSERTIAVSFNGWCAGTARHVSSDLWRRPRYESLPPEAIDIPARDSTEELVEGGLSFLGFSRAWKTLTPGEREALLSAAPEGATAAELNRFYVGLHRLRQRTRRLADSFTPGIVGVIERVREVLGVGGVEIVSGAFAVAAGLAVGSLVQPVAPTLARPQPSVNVTVAGLSDHRSPVAPSTLAGRGDVQATGRARRDAALTRQLPPVEKRAATRLPDGRVAHGEISRGDPYDPPPLVCAGLTGMTPPMCVDYPVRP